MPDTAEWEMGPLNEQGQKNGRFQGWRANGTFCYELQIVNNIPDGPFRRFHDNGDLAEEGTFLKGKLHGKRVIFRTAGDTSEPMPEGLTPGTWRAELVYERGRLLSRLLFDREGRHILADGAPLPERPSEVPADAEYNPEQRTWFQGGLDEQSERTGLWRIWSHEGALIEEAAYRAGARHGSRKCFDPTGRLLSHAYYRNGQLHGPFRARVPTGRYEDERIRIETGSMAQDLAVGRWTFADSAGITLQTIDRGIAFHDEELDLAEVFLNRPGRPGEWEESAERSFRERRMSEALCAAARASAGSSDAKPLLKWLAWLVVPLTREEAEREAARAADEQDGSLGGLQNALLTGAAPELILVAMARALSAHNLNRAALDFIDAALLLAPRSLKFYFDRALFNIGLGREHDAQRDADRLQSVNPDGAILIRRTIRVLFTRFDFWPRREQPTTTLLGLPERPAQDRDSIRVAIQKYATRLLLLREALRRAVGTTDQAWMIPDLSGLLPHGPVDLDFWEFEIPGDLPQTILVDETIDANSWDLISVLRQARADWSALTWLCYAIGLSEVELPRTIQPAPALSSAFGLFLERLKCCQGKAPSNTPLLRFEGYDLDSLAPPLYEIAASELTEIVAMFTWLTDANHISPWQNNLRSEDSLV